MAAVVIDECPKCHTKRVALAVGASTHVKNERLWFICICGLETCTEPLLVEYGSTESGHSAYTALYPPLERTLNPGAHVSDEIREDFDEAGRALGASCFKASMVMSRRALQRLLKEQGCTQREFVDAIDYAKKELIIRKALHEAADEVRKYGNLGAHPDDDQLCNCTRETSNYLLDFIEVMIEDVYEMPVKIAKLKSRREAAQGP